jgi:hypothetical protein
VLFATPWPGPGFALETTKSTQAGELLLVSTPLALVRHSAEELAAADDQQQQPYEPTDADIDDLADQLASNNSSRVQVMIALALPAVAVAASAAWPHHQHKRDDACVSSSRFTFNQTSTSPRPQ